MSTGQNNQFEHNEGNFGLPDDYFKKSANSIINRIAWEEEHHVFPALLKFKDKSGFTLPPGYFENNEHKLELTEVPTLQAISKTNPFKVPEGYFNQLEVSQLSTVMLDAPDELTAFKTLASVKKQNNFHVDEAYFEVNEKLLITLLKPEKSARIIDLFFSRSSYVAAAMLVTALGLWLYSIYIHPAQELKDCGTMACVDRVDLIKNKNLENLDNDELYELIDAGELEKKLDIKKAEPGTKQKRDSSINDFSVDELLDEI